MISHGFWPGGPPVLEATFYSYAVPEPAGSEKSAGGAGRRVLSQGNWGVRPSPTKPSARAADPDAEIRSFVNSTYQQAATLGRWDRQALRTPERLIA